MRRKGKAEYDMLCHVHSTHKKNQRPSRLLVSHLSPSIGITHSNCPSFQCLSFLLSLVASRIFSSAFLLLPNQKWQKSGATEECSCQKSEGKTVTLIPAAILISATPPQPHRPIHRDPTGPRTSRLVDKTIHPHRDQ